MSYQKRDLSARLRRLPLRSRRRLSAERLENRLALSNDIPFPVSLAPDPGTQATAWNEHGLPLGALAESTTRRQTPSWHVEYSQTLLAPSVQRIAALGDSMTYEGGGSYVSVLRNLLSSYTASIQTFASAGWKADKLLSVWETEIRGKGFDTLIVFSGIPDLSSVGTTAESTFQQLQALYRDATARGLNVICIGLSPWAQYKKWTIERQAETLQLNELIRQHVAANPTTMRFVDAYTELGSPDEPHRLWPRFDVGDGLHMVPVGDERLARLVSTAVLSVETAKPVPQSAMIVFDRDVYGLTQAHVRLWDAKAALPNQLVPLDASHYRIDFSVPSNDLHSLRLNLDLNQGPVVDDRNRQLSEQPDALISIDYQTPFLSFQSAVPSVSSLATQNIRVDFNEAVANLSLSNFRLLRNRVLLDPLQGLVARRDESTFDLWLDASQTTASGTYQLVYEPTLDVQDSAGNLARRGTVLTWVKLDVAPMVTSGTLKLPGTSGLDNLEVVVRQSSIDYTINGFERSFARTGIERIEIQPGLGRDLVALSVATGADPLPLSALSTDNQDRAYLYDSLGDDVYTASPSSASMIHGAIQLTTVGFVQVTAISRNGQDRATLIDSPGADTLDGASWLTTLKGSGYEVSAMNFPVVTAISQNGGSDTADLYDTVNNDNVFGTMDQVTLDVPGYQVSAQNFSRINVRASQGIDRVTLVGSAAVERFVGQVSSSVWSSGSLARYFYNFDQVDVSGGGGNDQVTLYDSPGNDVLIAAPRTLRLTRPTTQATIRDYPRANIYARTGLDTATLEGSELAETFVGQATYSSLSAPGVTTTVYGFDQVNSLGGGGNDTAKLFGSIGNDRFQARGQTARLVGSTFDNTVTNYKSVQAYSQAGSDTALLVGTSATETVTAKPTLTTMTSSAFVNAAHNFAQVTVDSGGGSDIANLMDSAGDDRLVANPVQSTLVGVGYSITARNYVRVNAYASTGIDRAELSGSSGDDTFTGRPADSSLRGATYLVYASGFDSVAATGAGGNDVANLYDSAGDDQATISPTISSFIGMNYNHSVTDFDRVQMYASSGNDTAYYTDSTGNDRLSGSGSSATFTSPSLVSSLQRFKSITLSDSRGGTNQLLLSAITYQLNIGAGWSNVP